MGTFKNYTAQPGPNIVPASARANENDFGGRSAKELTNAGKALAKESSRILQANEQRDLINTYRDAAQSRERIRARLDELKLDGQPLADRTKEILEEETSAIRSDRETRRGRILADTTSANIRAASMHEARTHDVSLVNKAAKDASTQIMQSNGVILQQTPEVFLDIVSEQNNFVDELDIPPNLKTELKRQLNAEAAKNAARGYIELDPAGAKKLLADGELDEYIEADNKAVLMGQANTRIKGLAAEERIKEAEFTKQKSITSNTVMNDAIIAAHSSNPDEVLTASQVTELALQTHKDGDPVLTPAQVSGLYTIIENNAKIGSVSTSPDVALDVVSRLDSITPKELTEIMADPSRPMSGTDYERWMTKAKEGGSALKAVRGESLRNVPGTMGVPPVVAQMIPGFSKAYIELEALTRDRELEYKEANKNPIDYYTDGSYEKDVMRIGRDLDLVTVGTEIRTSLEGLTEGDVINGFKYIGGDPNDMLNSWVPEEIKPQEFGLGKETELGGTIQGLD